MYSLTSSSIDKGSTEWRNLSRLLALIVDVNQLRLPQILDFDIESN